MNKDKIIARQKKLIEKLIFDLEFHTHKGFFNNSYKVSQSELAALTEAKEQSVNHWKTLPSLCPNCKHFKDTSCILLGGIKYSMDSCSLFEYPESEAKEVKSADIRQILIDYDRFLTAKYWDDEIPTPEHSVDEFMREQFKNK
jgi:hypothetical protein